MGVGPKSTASSCVGKLFFPFLAKSRAHTYTLYAHGHETLQGMGKIIFQCNCNIEVLGKLANFNLAQVPDHCSSLEPIP